MSIAIVSSHSEYSHSKYSHSKYSHSKYSHSKYSHSEYSHSKYSHSEYRWPVLEALAVRPFVCWHVALELREHDLG